MNAINEKIQTQGTRGTQESYLAGVDSYGNRRTRPTSQCNGSESISTGGDDREGRNSYKWSGQAITGGILNQAILKLRTQILDIEEYATELRNHLKDLEELSDQLNQADDDNQ
jgi:hypothetical protein